MSTHKTPTMVDSTPRISDGKEKKEGHRVLCCCDSRKAVIILNLITLALTIASLIGWVDNQYFNTLSITFYVLDLFFYSIVTWSALQFGKRAVELGIFWAIVDIIWRSIYLARNSGWMVEEGSSNRIATIVVYAIFYVFHVLIIYANWTYVSEVGKGTMSRETHSREKYSCCCNV